MFQKIRNLKMIRVAGVKVAHTPVERQDEVRFLGNPKG